MSERLQNDLIQRERFLEFIKTWRPRNYYSRSRKVPEDGDREYDESSTNAMPAEPAEPAPSLDVCPSTTPLAIHSNLDQEGHPAPPTTPEAFTYKSEDLEHSPPSSSHLGHDSNNDSITGSMSPDLQDSIHNPHNRVRPSDISSTTFQGTTLIPQSSHSGQDHSSQFPESYSPTSSMEAHTARAPSKGPAPSATPQTGPPATVARPSIQEMMAGVRKFHAKRGSKSRFDPELPPQETTTRPASEEPSITREIKEKSEPKPVVPTPKGPENVKEAQPAESSQAKHEASPTLAEQNPGLYFEKWPMAEKRQTPTSRVRKAIVTGLTVGDDPSVTKSIENLISSIVFGGPLESVSVLDSTTAAVAFLHAEDCQRFYDGTPNGLDYRKGGKDRTAWVDLGKEVDVVSGQLREWIEHKMTRCVRAVGNDFGVRVEDLRQHETIGKLVPVETKEEKLPNGNRRVTWRFTKIGYAVLFKASLARVPEWETFNIQFSPDPCDRQIGTAV